MAFESNAVLLANATTVPNHEDTHPLARTNFLGGSCAGSGPGTTFCPLKRALGVVRGITSFYVICGQWYETWTPRRSVNLVQEVY